MSQRSRSALTAPVCALLALLAAGGTQMAAETGAHAAAKAPQVVAVDAPCVRQGQAAYPVEYYWKNLMGMRLGGGSVSVATSPSLWGGQIAPGGTFTLTLTHSTTQWPRLWPVTQYRTTWDVSSLLAHADVVGQSGAGTVSGSTLSIPSPGGRADAPPQVITFRVRQGTIGGAMTIRPVGIWSNNSFPGQLGNNTAAPPIQIVSGSSISPANAADDTATTPGKAVSVPVLANDAATAPTISGLTQPQSGTATVSGGNVVYTPAAGFAGTDTFTYTITTACGTSTAKVTVEVTCTDTPVHLLVNGSFETPPVATVDWNIPDASADPSVGWHTTAAGKTLEFWRSGQGPGAVPAADGGQLAELNADLVALLYQDVPTVPGTRLTWSLYHRGRLGADVMRVLIGAPGAPVVQTPSGASSPDISDGNTAWGRHTGVYVVPPRQTTTRFAFQSVSATGDNPGLGNLIDGVTFGPPSCPTTAKAAAKAR